jgi:hypothetical protein
LVADELKMEAAEPLSEEAPHDERHDRARADGGHYGQRHQQGPERRPGSGQLGKQGDHGEVGQEE